MSRNHFPMSLRLTLVTLTQWETSQSPSSVKFWPLSHILLSWTLMSFQKTPRPEPEQSWRDVEEEVLDPTAPVLVWRSSDVMSPSTSRTGMEALSQTGRRSSCVLELVRYNDKLFEMFYKISFPGYPSLFEIVHWPWHWTKTRSDDTHPPVPTVQRQSGRV